MIIRTGQAQDNSVFLGHCVVPPENSPGTGLVIGSSSASFVTGGIVPPHSFVLPAGVTPLVVQSASVLQTFMAHFVVSVDTNLHGLGLTAQHLSFVLYTAPINSNIFTMNSQLQVAFPLPRLITIPAGKDYRAMLSSLGVAFGAGTQFVVLVALFGAECIGHLEGSADFQLTFQ